MNLVTIYRTFNDAEAHVVRSRLETANLTPRVEHELAGSSAGGFSVTTGGILVQVPEDQVAEARAIINDAEHSVRPPDSSRD